jgi:hypothetical protein
VPIYTILSLYPASTFTILWTDFEVFWKKYDLVLHWLKRIRYRQAMDADPVRQNDAYPTGSGSSTLHRRTIKDPTIYKKRLDKNNRTVTRGNQLPEFIFTKTFEILTLGIFGSPIAIVILHKPKQ